jgi:hypothetical protein
MTSGKEIYIKFIEINEHIHSCAAGFLLNPLKEYLKTVMLKAMVYLFGPYKYNCNM